MEGLYGDRLTQFRALAQELDPHGKFRNEWAAEMIFGEGAEEEEAVAAAAVVKQS